MALTIDIKSHCYSLTIILGFLLCLGHISYAQPTAPSPQTILKQMVLQYGGLSSYQDSGEVRQLNDTSDLSAKIESPHLQSIALRPDTLVSFNIYFARPKMFRFEWKSRLLGVSRAAAIWSDGKHVYEWMPALHQKNGIFILDEREGDDLWFSIDKATPSSAGSVFFVPTLLIKDAAPFPFEDILSLAKELSLVREEEVDGEMCYVIKCNLSGAPWVLWVGKQSHLLRRTRTLYATGGSFHENMGKGMRNTFIAEEVHRNIKINERIPMSVFSYRPKLHAHDFDLTH